MSIIDLKLTTAEPGASTPHCLPVQPVEPASPLRRVQQIILTWTERARSRRRLQSLDDHMLKDIGVARWQVHGEAKKPFWRV